MIWAVSIGVVCLYLILFYVTKQRQRVVAYPFYDDALYKEKSKGFACNLSPAKRDGCVLKNKEWLLQIRMSFLVLKRKKYLGLFDDFINEKAMIDKFKKVDFSALDGLPTIKNDKNDQLEYRIIKIARFVLVHNDLIFSKERLLSIVNEQNKRQTLTIGEVMTFNQAFLYVLLEQLHQIFLQLRTIAKVCNLAKSYCDNQMLATLDKKFNLYSKSPLFLALCAKYGNFADSEYTKEINMKIESLFDRYAKVLNCADVITKFDFSKYYSPLEIYDKFDVFSNASEIAKHNFLQFAGKVSDKENIDEFLFAVRLEKYMSTAQNGHVRVKRISTASTFFCAFLLKKDISTLGIALSSQYLMSLLFNDKNKAKSGKTISNIADFENTFEPIYKFQSLNFGISTTSNTLKISPHLPNDVVKADIVLERENVYHNLHIERGNENVLYLGNTRLKGISSVKLSDTPLDIRVVVKDE